MKDTRVNLVVSTFKLFDDDTLAGASLRYQIQLTLAVFYLPGEQLQ
jgi:hypothetical protein